MDENVFLRFMDQLVKPDGRAGPSSTDLRVRHVVKANTHYYLLFNEGERDLEFGLELSPRGKRCLLDPYAETAEPLPANALLRLPRHALRVLQVAGR